MSDLPNVNIKAAYIRDLAERVVWTFLQTFGAVLVASGVFDVAHITDVTLWAKAGVAGVAAVLSLAKGLVAKVVGNPDSAALAPGE